MQPVEIDGSFGEGGGQILRTSLALSSLLKRPLKIKNIRAKRKNPGLAAQHLTCINSLTEVCRAHTEGAHLRSTFLLFNPTTLPQPGSRFSFDIETAGSVSLLFHALYPVFLYSGGGELTLTGGTHVEWSPPFEHIKWAFAPALGWFGGSVDVELLRAGFYPRGGGIIRAKISPLQELAPIQMLKRGKVETLLCRIVLAKLPEHIARRQEKTLREALSGHNLRFVHLRPPAAGPGNSVSIQIVAQNCYALFSSLGRKGKPAEEVAREVTFAVERFLSTTATVDEHLADQLLLPAALARGKSRFLCPRVTQHLLTNAHVIKRFLDVDIRISEGPTAAEIEVEGCGYRLAS